MTVPASINVGAVVPPTFNNAFVQNGINIVYSNDNINLTLTGNPVSAEDAAAAKDASGNGSAFAEGLGATTNLYFLRSIDFQSRPSTITTASPYVPGNGILPIDLDTVTSLPTEVLNVGNTTLQLNSDLQNEDPSWLTINTINFANNQQLNYVTDSSIYPNPPNNPEYVDIYPAKTTMNFTAPGNYYPISNNSKNEATYKTGQTLEPQGDGFGDVSLTLGPNGAIRNITAVIGTGNGTTPGTKRFGGFAIKGPATSGVATVNSAIYAKLINISSGYPGPNNGIIWTTAIDTGVGGVIQFGKDSLVEFQQNIVSDIDFAGTKAVITLDDKVNVGGATGGNIDNLTGGPGGTVNFVGNSTVTGNVGATNSVNILNIQGDNTTEVGLQGSVTVNELNFLSTGIAAVAETLTATAGVEYNNFAATLAFANPVGSYTFSSPILQAGNGSVIVDTILTATDASIATAKAIQIGVNFTTAALTLAVNNPNLNLLAGGNQIIFENAGTSLILASPVAQAVTFGGNLDGFAGGGGNVTLNGTNALTIAGGSFGAVNKLASVSTIGTVTANGGINLSGITTLNVKGGSNFTDQTITSASATNISIGDGNGAGTYILTPNANFNLSTANMKFSNAGSILNIQSNGNVTATMNGDLNPGAVASGVVQLSSTGGLLTVTGANNLGINNGNTLNSIILAGNGDITITPAINIANALSTGIAGNLTLSTVNGAVNFTNTTTLAVTNVTGKTDFANNAGTINLANNGQLAAVTSNGGVKGTVNVLGAGVLGPVTGITALNLNGAGAVTINGASSATNLTINNAGVVATAAGGFTGNVATGAGQFTGNTTGNVTVGAGTYAGNITGSATFGGAGTINTAQIGGATDFAGNAGTVNVSDGGNLAAVTSSAAQAGTLAFAGAATVTGKVTNIGPITLNGAAGKTVNFQQDISATSLTFANPSTANLGGSLTTMGNVDFGVGGGTLQFSGGAASYNLSSPIANGATGILNVYANLIADDVTIGTVQTINIGQLNQPKTFTVDVSANGLSLLQPVGSTVNFGDSNSVFALTTNTNQTVTFFNSFDGFAGGGGIVNLSSTSNTSPNNTKLALKGDTGMETLGTKANPLAAVNISGIVAIAGNNAKLGTTGLDISNAQVLNIANGSLLLDQSITSATINKINIGDNTGPAAYALDALNGDFSLNSKGVVFVDPSSVLKLLTSVASGTTSTITLLGDVDPGTPHTGVVELSATNTKSLLKIAGLFSLGTIANPLKEIKFSGQGLFELGVVSTDNINLNTPGLALGDILAGVKFSTPSQLDTGSVTGDVDFQNNAGTIILDSKATIKYPNAIITGNITSTGGPNGTVKFVNNGTIGTVDGNGNSTNTITNLAMLQAGADNSTVTINAGGNMSIAEIQGTGTGTIVFSQATNLTGNINETGGTAVNLTFNNNNDSTATSAIRGNIGNAQAIGDITILAGTLEVGVPASVPDSIIKGGNVFLGSGALLDYDSSKASFTGVFNYVAPVAFGVLAAAPIPGGVRFDDSDPVTDNAKYGNANSPLGIIQVNGGDVTLTNEVYVNNVKFTTANAVTLTLANTSVIGGATTTGNKIHTLAITGDLTTGTSPFGSDSNHLKTIQLNDDGKFTIDSQDVYSSVIMD